MIYPSPGSSGIFLILIFTHLTLARKKDLDQPVNNVPPEGGSLNGPEQPLLGLGIWLHQRSTGDGPALQIHEAETRQEAPSLALGGNITGHVCGACTDSGEYPWNYFRWLMSVQ